MEMVYNYILNGNVVTRKCSSLSFINNNTTYSHSKQQPKLEKKGRDKRKFTSKYKHTQHVDFFIANLYTFNEF